MARKSNSFAPKKCNNKERIRKRTARLQRSPNTIEAERNVHRLQKQRTRRQSSPDSLEAERVSDRLRLQQARRNRSPETEHTEREGSRARMQRLRRERSPDTEDAEREAARARMQRVRRDRSPDTEEAEREINREQHEQARIQQRFNQNTRFMARRNAEFTTLPLTRIYCGNLNDETRSFTCPHCKAVKLPCHKNRKKYCCNEGNIAVPIFPNHPEPFRALWEPGNSQKYNIIKKHSRALNNSVAMSSLTAKAAPVPGGRYTPSVVIQGKQYTRAGSLLPDDGRKPVFSQLYVLDPAMDTPEEELRFQNMCLPPSTTETEKNCLRSVIKEVQEALKRHNPYVKDYRTAADIAAEMDPQSLLITIDDTKRPTGQHARCFNRGFSEISVIMDDSDAACTSTRKFTVRMKGGEIREIPEFHRSADPLHFPLLFPEGTDGWHLGMNISPKDFYAYQLQRRRSTPDLIYHNTMFRTGKLFGEYLCWQQAKIEYQRLKFLKHNQKTLRCESYRRVCEDVAAHRNNETSGQLRSGVQVVLPATFTSSPRYWASHFQDAMAICRVYHKPDFFITFTTNPYWQEILDSLLPGQKPEDAPDVVAQVFHAKLQVLLDYLLKKDYLGKVKAYMYVIEFQKRGLPHAHILLILKEEDRVRTAEEVDEIISAELPPDPSSYENPEEKNKAQELEDIIVRNMTHTCGPRCQKGGDSCPLPNESETNGAASSAAPSTSGIQSSSREDGKRESESVEEIIPINGLVYPWLGWLSLGYFALFLVGLFGNTAVLTSLVHTLRQRKKFLPSPDPQQTRILLSVIALVVMDMAVLLALPATISDLFLGHWVFGVLICKFHWMVESSSKFLSIFILVIFSYDRYMSVCWPHSCFRIRKPRTLLGVIGGFTLFTLGILSPMFVCAHIKHVELGMDIGKDRVIYTRNRCELGFSRQVGLIFTCYAVTFGFLIPASIIIFSNILLLLKVSKHRIGMRSGQSQVSCMRVAWYTMGVCLFYSSCWAPFWIAFALIEFADLESRLDPGMFFQLMHLLHALPFLSSAFNWLFYYLFNKEVQRMKQRLSQLEGEAAGMAVRPQISRVNSGSSESKRSFTSRFWRPGQRPNPIGQPV